MQCQSGHRRMVTLLPYKSKTRMKYMKQLCLGFGENTACNYNPWEKDNSWAESPFTLVFCPGTSQIAAQGRRTHKEDSSLTGQGKHWSCLGPTSLLCSVAQEAEMRELHREGASEICIVVPSGIWLNTNPCSARLDSTGLAQNNCWNSESRTEILEVARCWKKFHFQTAGVKKLRKATPWEQEPCLRAVVPQVWSPEQQPQHHVWTCWKCQCSDPNLVRESETRGVGSSTLWIKLKFTRKSKSIFK